jgi:UDP-glucose 4-epimerase
MVEAPKVVAITGASGYIGSRLLQQLERENLEKLVAFDIKPPTLPVHNIAVYRQDVSRPIDNALRQNRVTTLVHLAFIWHRGYNRRTVRNTRENNLRALHTVLDSCSRAGVQHIIYLSSHTVYGTHRDNSMPVTERTPLSPMQDLPFSYDIFLSDQVMESFAERHPEITVTILRSSTVLGPTADKNISRIFAIPQPIGVCGCNPPFQFLHEDDLARIITGIIQRAVSGVFNVAGDGVAFYREIAEAVPGKLRCWPAFLAYPMLKLTWSLGLQRTKTTAELDLLRYPMLLNTGKLTQATDYRLKYTSLEALTAFVNSVLI